MIQPDEAPNVLLERDQNQHNILNIFNILDSPRKTTCFYINTSVAKAFRTYARFHPHQILADCLEKALLNYMKQNPLNGVTLNVELVEKIRDGALNGRIEEKVLSSEITRVLSIIDRRSEKGLRDNSRNISDLHGLLLRAIKLKSPGHSMTMLLERAEGYL